MEPPDEGPSDSKIIPLFPAKSGSGSRKTRPPEQREGKNPGALHLMRGEIDGIIDLAEDVPPKPAPATTNVPDPAHRNAMRCPQCDQYTWRESPYCLHCGKDLVAHAERLADGRRERLQGIFWACAIGSWAIAPSCFYVTQHYALPPRVRTALNYIGTAIIAVNLFGFWIASMGKRP